MLEPVLGLLPLDDLLAGLHVDVRGKDEPAGDSIEYLLQAVERHVQGETSALGAYQRLAEASGDAAVALVMRLILNDEERHHTLLKRIAATLRDALNWTASPDALPRSAGADGAPAGELAKLAGGLMGEERAGAQALRELAHAGKRLDSGLHSLLLEMMAMDSDKHAHLLQFVQRRLERRAAMARTGPGGLNP